MTRARVRLTAGLVALSAVVALTGCDTDALTPNQPCGGWFTPCHFVHDNTGITTTPRTAPRAPAPAKTAPRPATGARK